MPFPNRHPFSAHSAHEPDSFPFVRCGVFQVMKASGGLYPAPLKILEIIKKNVGGKKLCTGAGYDLEADGFADLALTPESAGTRSIRQYST